MEQLNFSSWIKTQSSLDGAGDAYFSLSELSKEVIDAAVDRYVEYIKAFTPMKSLNDFDRGFFVGWEDCEKEYKLSKESKHFTRPKIKQMKKPSFTQIIKQKISAIAFRIFLWGISMTKEQYWQEIYQQEHTLSYPSPKINK